MTLNCFVCVHGVCMVMCVSMCTCTCVFMPVEVEGCPLVSMWCSQLYFLRDGVSPKILSSLICLLVYPVCEEVLCISWDDRQGLHPPSFYVALEITALSSCLRSEHCIYWTVFINPQFCEVLKPYHNALSAIQESHFSRR